MIYAKLDDALALQRLDAAFSEATKPKWYQRLLINVQLLRLIPDRKSSGTKQKPMEHPLPVKIASAGKPPSKNTRAYRRSRVKLAPTGVNYQRSVLSFLIPKIVIFLHFLKKIKKI